MSLTKERCSKRCEGNNDPGFRETRSKHLQSEVNALILVAERVAFYKREELLARQQTRHVNDVLIQPYDGPRTDS